MWATESGFSGSCVDPVSASVRPEKASPNLRWGGEEAYKVGSLGLELGQVNGAYNCRERVKRSVG